MTAQGPEPRYGSAAPPTVLVLGEESRVLLPIIRSLAAKGIDVDLAWCPRREPARASRHVRRVHDLAAIDDDRRSWLDELIGLHRHQSFELIIPATESATWSLHRSRASWKATLPVTIGPAAALDVAFDKIATRELARSLGIPVPDAVDVTSCAGARRAVEDADLTAPFVVKPRRSIAADGLGKAAVRIVDDIELLVPAIEAALVGGPLQVQRYVPGRGVGVEVLARDGEILLAFQHRRLHETTGFGSTYRESTPIEPELFSAAVALARALDYSGVAMFEFRVDRPSGAWVLLEINPRFWGSLPLSVAAGVDFPAALYEMERSPHPPTPAQIPTPYRVGVRSRDLLNDVRWMWHQRSGADNDDGGAGWATNRVGRRELAGDVARMLTLRDHSDTFAWPDPLPSIVEVGRIGRVAADFVAKRIRPSGPRSRT